jgi:hypothetical protein
LAVYRGHLNEQIIVDHEVDAARYTVTLFRAQTDYISSFAAVVTTSIVWIPRYQMPHEGDFMAWKHLKKACFRIPL